MSVLDTRALRTWLAEHVNGIDGEAPITHEVISGGASNITMAVTVGEREVIVRHPPATAFLPTANDVGREFRFYTALQQTPVPTPRAFAFCEDASVIGAPFYVMERLHGIVPHEPGALTGLTPAQGQALSERFVDVLVAIHAIDWQAVGLGTVGRPAGYLERQVQRWTDQWHRAKEQDDPVIDELARRLGSALPASPASTIVHGDYRLGNVMLDAADRSRIVGVFDWEMATIGDPLADVGYTLLYWGTTDRPPIHPSQTCADLPGFLTAEELTTRYAARSGRTVEHVTFYIVLAAFKLAIIAAGNRARMRRAGVDLPRETTNPLVEWALDLWNGQSAS